MPERFLAVNGATLWVSEGGAGPPLLLCNGGPGCPDYLGPVAALVEDVARVIRFEPRGCGRSSPAGPYDLETTLADLEGLREGLGLERWAIGGHSGGADLALAYALTHPERATALLHLSGTGVQDDRSWQAEYHRGREEGRERAPEFAYPFNETVNREGNASWRRFIKGADLLRRLAELAVPALFVYGSEDIRPSWPVRQLAHLLPNARFVMLEGAEHHLWLDRPEELGAVLRSFLAEVA